MGLCEPKVRSGNFGEKSLASIGTRIWEKTRIASIVIAGDRESLRGVLSIYKMLK